MAFNTAKMKSGPSSSKKSKGSKRYNGKNDYNISEFVNNQLNDEENDKINCLLGIISSGIIQGKDTCVKDLRNGNIIFCHSRKSVPFRKLIPGALVIFGIERRNYDKNCNLKSTMGEIIKIIDSDKTKELADHFKISEEIIMAECKQFSILGMKKNIQKDISISHDIHNLHNLHENKEQTLLETTTGIVNLSTNNSSQKINEVDDSDENDLLTLVNPNHTVNKLK